MALSKLLPGSLQENLLTLLVHSDEHGRVIKDLVEPALFEGDYRTVAERACGYWARYGKAPKAHMSDLLTDIFDSSNDRRGVTFRNILVDMLRLSEDINAKYALDSVRTFVRMQKFQTATLEAARRFQSQHELALPEVEEMWSALLRSREATLDRGVSLNDTGRLIEFLQMQSSEFKLGIKELDARGISPMRGAVMLFIAPTGVGKSWALIHAAKNALMQRKKVLYITLEMSEAEVMMRFYQSFFSVTDRTRFLDKSRTRRAPLYVSIMGEDSLGKLNEITREEIVPEFALDSPNLEDELETRRRLMEGKFKNIEIKKFPMRSLTITALRAYMDTLEVSGFIPDVLILDYIGIMKTNSSDASNHRISLGSTFGDFRGLCDERNIAGITAQQVNRSGSKQQRASQTDIAEAWALAGDSDMTLSISATSAEKRYGFARLFVEKSRRSRDRFGVLLTQSYDTGQFVLQSAPLDEERYDSLFAGYARGDAGDAENSNDAAPADD